MENIYLCIMTRELCHEFFKEFENDPDIFTDMDQFIKYKYNKCSVDKYFDSKQNTNRVILAVMKEDKPIGEIQLKNIDHSGKECTLSIHMQNDTVKGHGYGTYAEKLALKYAFEDLGLNILNADTVIKNTRSQHVLEKVGFRYIKEENGFRYYRFEREI